MRYEVLSGWCGVWIGTMGFTVGTCIWPSGAWPGLPAHVDLLVCHVELSLESCNKVTPCKCWRAVGHPLQVQGSVGPSHPNTGITFH